jgi:hypothetical protein
MHISPKRNETGRRVRPRVVEKSFRRQRRRTVIPGADRIQFLRECFTRCRCFGPAGRIHGQNRRGRAALPATRPLVPSLQCVSKSRLFCFIFRPRVTAVQDYSNASSSHRPYGVRRQRFWQRPPFSTPLLVQISACVTSLSGPAMHIFSGLGHFGQMCSDECKSAVHSAVIPGLCPPFMDIRDGVRTQTGASAMEEK